MTVADRLDLMVAREALREILLETRRKISYADRLAAITALAQRALEATEPAKPRASEAAE